MAVLLMLALTAWLVFDAARHKGHPFVRWLVPAGAVVVTLGLLAWTRLPATASISIIGAGLALQVWASIRYSRWRRLNDPAQWQLDREFTKARTRYHVVGQQPFRDDD